MIEIKNLGLKVRENTALKNINLTLDDGEIVGITGRSGSGKTTLLKAVAGMSGSLRGSISFNGASRPVRDSNSARVVTYSGNTPRLNSDERLASFLLLARNPFRRPFRPFSDYDRQVTYEYIALLGLDPLKEIAIGALSDGAFRRAMVARALIRESHAILLDNPTNDLDPSSIRMLQKTLARYVMEGNRIAAIASNDLNFISRIADRIIVMEDGAIAEIGGVGILSAEKIKRYFDVDVIVSRNIYSGKPEIQIFPDI